jgi:hypothetical protein
MTGYVGIEQVTLDIRRDGLQWLMNAIEVPEVAGSEDIDLGFSPSTNLLPIRRLALKVGEHATVRAAWVRFPELTLELLEQTYTRISPDCYRYESEGGEFRRDLKTDENGFVVEYPTIWYAEGGQAHGAESLDPSRFESTLVAGTTAGAKQPPKKSHLCAGPLIQGAPRDEPGELNR